MKTITQTIIERSFLENIFNTMSTVHDAKIFINGILWGLKMIDEISEGDYNSKTTEVSEMEKEKVF